MTPIQLTIDRIKNRFSKDLSSNDKDEFKDNLKIINNQIKQIEKLVNEFSDFARMPKPVMKKNNLVTLMNDTINLLSQLDKSIDIKFDNNQENIELNSDPEQLSRVFFNLIKNSIESIQQKSEKSPDFDKKISIELNDFDDHIQLIINDNGIGFGVLENKIKDILNPYFTTKKNGTGLGLSIVNKIVNDHNGKLNFFPQSDGVKIEISFEIHDS